MWAWEKSSVTRAWSVLVLASALLGPADITVLQYGLTGIKLKPIFSQGPLDHQEFPIAYLGSFPVECWDEHDTSSHFGPEATSVVQVSAVWEFETLCVISLKSFLHSVVWLSAQMALRRSLCKTLQGQILQKNFMLGCSQRGWWELLAGVHFEWGAPLMTVLSSADLVSIQFLRQCLPKMIFRCCWVIFIHWQKAKANIKSKLSLSLIFFFFSQANTTNERKGFKICTYINLLKFCWAMQRNSVIMGCLLWYQVMLGIF